jgi:hypothetical protein
VIRAIVIGALLTAIAIVLTIRLLPSFATIDVTAKTDVVSFETAPTIVSNELHFGVTNAAVCSYAVDDALSVGAPAHSCEALGRQAVEASYNGDVLLVGAVRVSLQRSQSQLEVVAVPLAADASVTIGGHPIPDGAFLTMTATTASPRLLSFGALVRSVVLGQSGIDRSRPASLLLEGTLQALATDGLNHTVLQGPKVSLGLGDQVRLTAGKPEDSGTLFTKVEGTDAINVALRYSAPAVTIQRFGGQGVPVEFSWWERLKADPTLIAVWVFFGFWISLLGSLQKLFPGKGTE